MPTPKEEDFQGTDRFGIQRRLGAGAFGVVYQVYDRERGTVVALKTLRQSNVEALYRLKREFRALADIAHPNLVNLYELLTHEEQWFFTMELVEGVNFLRYARQGAEPAEASLSDEPTSPMDGPAPIRPTPASASSAQTDRLRAALRQAVHGIQALHAAGKLHRDLKPSNILVTREGRLVLLDFGLVTELGGPGSGGSRSLVGTPAYMPPEQGSGLPVTEASDWYSLGIMLYETLTGQWPFSGSFVATMWAKQHAEAPAPRDLAPEVPEDLNALCRDLLRRDPKDRPTGEQILARLGGVQGATFEQAATVPAARSAPFVGREAHFSVLRSAFLATKEGRAVIVHVRGTSGTGKTALVRRFLEELRNRNAVVLAGRCYERETVPYKALDSLVDALSQHLKRLPADEVNAILPRDVLALARLFPVLRRVEAVATAKRRVLEIPDSQELRRRAFGALRELLARLAEQRDVVLCIDDLQWGDVDSAALLADLLRPPNPPSLLFIACCRSEDVAGSPFMRKLRSVQPVIEAPESRELVVGELTLQEARDLAESLLGQDSAAREADADTIARESGGNPFFIDELVRYSQAGVEFSEHDPLRDRSARGASARGTTLEEVIRARVLRLPEPARRLLDVLAIAGQPLPSDVARRAAHLGDEEESLSLLRARHLVRTRTGQEGDEIEPYHNRIRETVAAHVPPETRRELHRRLAVALEGSGRADPETLALHFQEAGNLERAAEYAVTAAGRASDALAFYRAARLYRVALELRPREGPQRRELYVKLGNALSNAGHGAEAAHAYLEAVEGARAADAMELQRNAAEQFLISGHIEEGLSVVAAVLANIGMKLPRTRLGALLSVLFRRVLIRARGIGFRERDATQVSAERLTRIDTCWSVAKGLSLADPLRSNEFQTRHLLMALTTGEPYRIARALAIEAGHSAQAGGRKPEPNSKTAGGCLGSGEPDRKSPCDRVHDVGERDRRLPRRTVEHGSGSDGRGQDAAARALPGRGLGA